MWVYDPSTKSWYNPDEFEKKYGSISVGFEKFIEQVQVRDPFEGIKAGYQRMLDLQIKHEDFTKRVVEYYKKPNT